MPTQPASTTLDLAAISAAARRCLASASRDPRHDTTTAAVRDLDQVRRALGYDMINIYGPSYGVTLGLAFLSFVSDYLGEAQTAVQLPAVLHALALGQWSQVVARLGLTTASLSGGLTSLQAVTIECSDAWAGMNPATVSQQGPSVFAPLVTAQAERLHALCSAWPHDPGVSGTVRSAVPVVFLNGAADLADPPANVAGAAATMPNALLVSVPGTGHWILNNATGSGCLLAATTAFIQAGQPASPAPWNACTRALAQDLVPFPGP